MEKIKIKVEFNSHSSRYTVTANQGKFLICSFWKSGISDLWFFWPSTDSRKIPIVDGVDGAFPVEYLISLCKCVWFLSFGTGELPEIELTRESKRLLKIR